MDSAWPTQVKVMLQPVCMHSASVTHGMPHFYGHVCQARTPCRALHRVPATTQQRAQHVLLRHRRVWRALRFASNAAVCRYQLCNEPRLLHEPQAMVLVMPSDAVLAARCCLGPLLGGQEAERGGA